MTEGLCRGIKEHVLEDLTPLQERALLKLLSRVSEASYRRGAQQGAYFQAQCPEKLPKSLCSWRYDRSLDTAPTLDGGRPIPSLSTAEARFLCEYRHALWHVGIYPRKNGMGRPPDALGWLWAVHSSSG